MKKTKLILIAILIVAALVLSGCEAVSTGNRVVYGKDVQTFTYAYISLDGQEIVKGFITQWRDYDNSDVVQIMIGGKYYLTHYSNVIMIADPEHGTLDYTNPDYFNVD